MSIRNKNKDHLKDHGGIELVAPAMAPNSDDPLRFWTGHPTENCLVDLHEFADGVSDDSNLTGDCKRVGGFAGRPELIAELAPAIQARVTLMAESSCSCYLVALRKFWRVCDQLEATVAPGGRTLDRLTSVRNLTNLHEAAMHRAKFDRSVFGRVSNVLNDTRRLLRLRGLLWTVPKRGEPDRQLIPDSQAKELKIGLKRDWEQVRKTWERHDAVRRGEVPNTLNEFEKQDAAIVREYNEQNHRLRNNWLHFERTQKSTGKKRPTSSQLYEGETQYILNRRGLYVSQMRAIAFPTMREANVAFHSALMRSGWNPSTLINGIDATMPSSIFQHPKDAKQRVLAVQAEEGETQDNTEEFNMQGSKRRAGGRLQFCMGLKKDPDCPPNIVAAYLDRTWELRAQLYQDVDDAEAAYQLLQAHGAPKRDIERQFKRLQTLQRGTRNVWLYVDHHGGINWLAGSGWKSFSSPDATNFKGTASYLDLLVNRLNVQRLARLNLIEEEARAAQTEIRALAKNGDLHMDKEPANVQTFALKSLAIALQKLALQKVLLSCEKTTLKLGVPIAPVTPSDFRDIYARWVYLQTGGNILAVMIALGHATLKATDGYTTNNIFSAENDEAVRRFMTHLFDELAIGRLDLTILAQLVRHGAMTDEMLARLTEYRSLTRSRIKVACADVRNPPATVDPGHIEGKRCGTHRCLRQCPHARFLPESLDGIAMRVAELMAISDQTSIDAWINGGFDKELEAGEYLLDELYPHDEAEQARAHWQERILSSQHVVPGVGFIRQQEAV